VRILVTFALEAEFAPWRKIRDFRRDKWGLADVYTSEIGGAQIGVVLTGVGPRQAALAASRALAAEQDSLKFCISSGVAGALRPEYKIGQVLAAGSVSVEFRHSSADRVLESSAPLISFAAELGATPVGRFFTAEHVLLRAEEKHYWGREADAVDMESFEILRKCAEWGVPAAAIRAVSDTADEELPFDMNRILDDRGHVSLPLVMGQVVLHPRSLPGLVNLGQRSRRAAESLTRFLDHYVSFVAERAGNLEGQASVAAAYE
jgi:adenosylhomocysteine nucleosidase